MIVSYTRGGGGGFIAQSCQPGASQLACHRSLMQALPSLRSGATLTASFMNHQAGGQRPGAATALLLQICRRSKRKLEPQTRLGDEGGVSLERGATTLRAVP